MSKHSPSTKTKAQECHDSCSDYSCVRAGVCTGSAGVKERMIADAAERGRVSGAHYRQQQYAKVHGGYPSNPYHHTDPRFEVFNAAYQEAADVR